MFDPDGYSALGRAITKGDVALVKKLIYHGANTEQRETEWGGHRPLSLAASVGNAAIVRLLYELKVKKNPAVGWAGQPLREAACRGHLEVMEFLLQSPGVDVNSQDERNDFTALHYAAMYGKGEAAYLLMRHGASLTLRTFSGWLPIDFAMGAHRDIANGPRVYHNVVYAIRAEELRRRDRRDHDEQGLRVA